MKRIIALLLALLLTLSVSAFAEGKLPDGSLYMNGQTEAEGSAHAQENTGRDLPDLIYFDNLTSMLLSLKAGRIGMVFIPESVARYIAARNDDITEPMLIELSVSFGMATTEENTVLLGKLNAAIQSLKESGELAAIYDKCVAELATNPLSAEIPVIEGAETVKVALTGDLPPFDYVSADGKPAGFNIELLSAIGKLANINFELVVADAGSRAAMVASGRADVVFWMQQLAMSVEGEEKTVFTENLEGLSLTDVYVKEQTATLALK